MPVMRFGRGGHFTGQFVAQSMRSDFSDTFTLEVCGNGIVDPGEECDGGDQPNPCCSDDCQYRAARHHPARTATCATATRRAAASASASRAMHLVSNDHNICTDGHLPTGRAAATTRTSRTASRAPTARSATATRSASVGSARTSPIPIAATARACTQDLCDDAAGSCLNPPVLTPTDQRAPARTAIFRLRQRQRLRRPRDV